MYSNKKFQSAIFESDSLTLWMQPSIEYRARGQSCFLVALKSSDVSKKGGKIKKSGKTNKSGKIKEERENTEDL